MLRRDGVTLDSLLLPLRLLPRFTSRRVAQVVAQARGADRKRPKLPNWPRYQFVCNRWPRSFIGG